MVRFECVESKYWMDSLQAIVVIDTLDLLIAQFNIEFVISAVFCVLNSPSSLVTVLHTNGCAA